MIIVENQTLLYTAIKEKGSVLYAFDIALKNGFSVTDLIAPGQILNDVERQNYESFESYELVQKYIEKRNFSTIIIENQSLIDIAMQEDGSVFAVVDWAFKNDISVTDLIAPGAKMKAPKSQAFRDDDMVNYWKSNNKMIATYRKQDKVIVTEFEYLFPGEFPFSF